LIATVYRGQGQGTQVGCACLAYEAEVKSLSHAVRQENPTLTNNATGNKGLDVPYAVIHEPLRLSCLPTRDLTVLQGFNAKHLTI
jgi:hypothetical protein